MPANSIFSRSYNQSTFSSVRFDPSTCNAKNKNKTKNASEFEISLFYWSFSSDIMAVKRLTANQYFTDSVLLKLY